MFHLGFLPALLPLLLLFSLVLGGIVCAALAILLKQPLLGLVALAPVLVAVLFIAFGGHVGGAAVPGLWTVVAIGFAALGVVAGSPITVAVLRRTPDAAPAGVHGGIVIDEKGARGATTSREVLRGGATIGYLERLAIVGAIAVGHVEVIAAIIAIKGLGRYSELDTPAARERFIIGTLASMIWAGVCGAIIWLG